MSRHYNTSQYFSDLSFSQKANMSYLDWCIHLLSLYTDHKFYDHVKADFIYMKGYFSFGDIFYYLGLFILYIGNIILFPIFALFLKLHWSNRYEKITKESEKPMTSILVNSIENPHLNGLTVLNVLETFENNKATTYKVILKDKSIHVLDQSELIFKSDLINKKRSLEKELRSVDYQIGLFPEDDKTQ